MRCGGGFTANTFAFATRAETPAPGSTTHGATAPLATTTVYDFYTGLAYSTTGANGETTGFEYEDEPGQLDRLKAVVRPGGGRTDFNYGDTAGNLYLRTLADLDGARRTESRQYSDGLGRPYRTATLENSVAAAPWVMVDTEYDALGRVRRTSMPYRSAGPGSVANVALASAGATATAENHTADGVYPGLTFRPTYVNDGRRYVSPQGDRYWRNGPGLPTWGQVDFSGQKTIGEVDVYTLADYPAYETQSDPTATQTFTQYGATSFEVQYWTGSAWVTVPGGSVSGNDKVWRKFTFPAVVTSKVRVLINNALASRSRLVEVEAWGAGAASTTADVRWLVSDHLGTPRMVVNQTGSLAGVSRHDYLPFGEGLYANTGGRTGTQGYGATDNVRQQYSGRKAE